ncbi:MAG: hypothetical protein K2O04_03215 [Clostridiales bacterium]|nr:hypothetical protein [Clostridiales bacterium]
MKDKRIDNAIESINSDRKKEMRAQLHSRVDIPQQEQAQTKSMRRVFNAKTVVFGALGICAVCLAIILPITLSGTTSQPSGGRYNYVASELLHDDLGCTLKEYVEQTDKNILYIDWYDVADDCLTEKYFLPDNENNIIYIREDLYHGETGDHVALAVIARDNSVDWLDSNREGLVQNYVCNNTRVYWGYEVSLARAYFEYNGYNYNILLYEPMTEDAILDIVKEML